MSDDIYAVIEQQSTQRQSKTAATATGDSRPFDKEAYAARKKAEREDAYALIDTATERVTQDAGAFFDYLDVMARFPRLSTSNTLLVFAQMPEATRLGDFNYWKKAKESVKRGESGLSILVPGDEYTKDDGSIGVSYNVKKTFDESQTSTRHLEPRYAEMRALLFALAHNAPVNIKAAEDMDASLGHAHYDHEANAISVRKGLDAPQLFRAFAIELAHAELAAQDAAYTREKYADTALFSGYVISRRSGIKAFGGLPTQPPSSENASLQEVREKLSLIRNTAKTVTDRMDKVLEASKAKDVSQETKVQLRGDRDGR
jgi:hypothetical protein